MSSPGPCRGKEQLLRLTMQMGILVARVVPELADGEEAVKELEGLSYVVSPSS